jgi:uncharacterized protein YqeY
MSAPLWDRILEDLKVAMKTRNELRTSVIRGLKSDLKYKEIELGHELTEDECIAVFLAAAKRRRDAIDAFTKGGRVDRAAVEEAELAEIKKYLPAELSEEELINLVAEAITETGATGAKDFGTVMKATMAKAAGRAEGKRVSAVVTAQLKK